MKLLVKFIFSLMCVTVFTAHYSSADALITTDKLAADVSALKLGFGNYVIGSVLDKEQIAQAQKKPISASYPGTYKFEDNNVFVVVDSENNRVLATYMEQKDIKQAQLRQAIAGLMNQFGEPTTIAHEKLIYWAYGQEGKFSEESLEAAKKTGKIDILATVKFSSSTEVMSVGNTDENQASTIYTLISSPPLLEQFANNPQ